MLPALHEDLDDDDAQGFGEQHKERLGKQLLAKHWKDAELVGLHQSRPAVMTALHLAAGSSSANSDRTWVLHRQRLQCRP